MHQFDQDISITEMKDSLFKGNVTANWSINGNPNGGYLMAILTNAMLQHSEKKSASIITTHFISRCVPGEAHISIENINRSRQFERWQAKLSQEGREKIRATGTFANAKNDHAEKRYEKSEPYISPWEDCMEFKLMPKYTLFKQMDVRLDPSCTEWLKGNLMDRSELKGWIQFKDDRPFDDLSILLIADSFPPPVLASHGSVAWVPTIEFSVSIRNRPSSRRLKCIFQTHFINDGIFEEDGEIWDQNGELIAISRQIGLFRKGKSR